MSNLAVKVVEAGVVAEAGTVVATDLSGLLVRTAHGEVLARRAVSCLVAPEVDDRVLVASGPGVCHVLAVLERSVGRPLILSIDSDVTIRSGEGRLTLAAQQGVELVSAERISLASDRLEMNAREARASFGAFAYIGQRMKAELDRVKLFAERLDVFADRLVQRARNVHRTVDELEQARVGTLDVTARGMMSHHAENQLMTAEKLVKVDGDQIHMG